jgi:hypothetical protein
MIHRICIVILCIAAMACNEPTLFAPESRGKLGEDCQARNDCESGLACLNGICQKNDFDITPKSKQCYYIECATNDDCCLDFQPMFNCEDLETACEEEEPESYECQQYDEQCVCNLKCEDERCVDDFSCTTDNDCNMGKLCDMDEGECVQCLSTDDCYGEDEMCLEGVCEKPCIINEDCPVLHACQSGSCVETGCLDDLTCIYLLNNKRSVCRETLCLLPCESDGECGVFELCQGGVCVDIGCDTDEQCRTRGYDFMQGNNTVAVCREAE